MANKALDAMTTPDPRILEAPETIRTTKTERHPRVTSVRTPGVKVRVKQSFRDQADINHIMEQWISTGEPPLARDQIPQYGDFSNVGDYRTALHAVIAAQEDFDALPVEIRNRMGNNPIALMGFLEDPANTQEAIDLGLIDKSQALPYSEMAEIQPEETPDVVPLNPDTGAPVTPVPDPSGTPSEPPE